MLGAARRACSNRSRTRAAPTPTNISTNSEPVIEKNGTLASPAIARASSVFPVATKAAVAEGIVPGGGLALLRCIEAVAQEEAKCEGDERTGVQVLKRALEAPTRQIAENSSVDGGVVVARMLGGQGNYGFDASRNEYVDLVEAGIIDPTKVLRIALENAVSVASVLLLTEATMTEIPEATKEHSTTPEMPY
jgi:chaperonin GroEL